MTDPEAARYLLPEEENRRIFREEIVPDLLSGRVPQEKPSVVFLVGQPGAGKSRVTEMVAEILNQRGGFADIDSDLYKPYHPAYDELMARDDTLMAAYTRADGRKWMAQAEEYVRAQSLNAVIQETSQNGAAVAEKMRAYRDAGFRVEVVVMGVSEAMSNQGIVNRYHEQVKERGHGRLTVQANADESYKGILDLADRIDKGRLADQVGVFRRGENKPRYVNALNSNGEWQSPPTLRAAIETERARPWSERENQDFTQVQVKLRTEMGPQWRDRLDRIEAQAAPLMSPATANALREARRAAAAVSTSRTRRSAPPEQAPRNRPQTPSAPQAAPRREGPDPTQGRGRGR